MAHWAFAYLSDPNLTYEGVGKCYGLVVRVFAEQFGVRLPHVEVGGEHNEGALRAAAEASGWRLRRRPPALTEGDVAFMDGPSGKHVGIVVRANNAWHLLHAVLSDGVCLTRMDELGMWGFRNLHYWSRPQ